MLVAPIEAGDVDAVASIAEAAGLTVDPRAELAKSWAHAWVLRAEAGGPVRAFLIAWLVADELQLNHVATHPDARRRGYAGRLVDALLALGQQERCRVVVLEVRRSNLAAIQLYRSRGFRAIGLRKRYYQDDGEDAVEMMLNLDAHGNVEPRHDDILLEGAP